MNLSRPRATLLLVLCCACQDPYRVPEQERARATLRWSIENPAHRPVELWVHQGHMLVESAPAGSALVDVTVDVTVHADVAAEAERLLRGVEQTRPRATDHKIALQLSVPLGAALESVEMDYRVTVPNDCDLRIFTKSGRVALRGFTGRAHVESETGDISARLDGGAVDLFSGTGTVRVEGVFARASLRSRTGRLELLMPSVEDGASAELENESGGIALEMCENIVTTLDFRSVVGKFESEVPLRVSDTQSRPSSRERTLVGALGSRDAEPKSTVTVRTDQSVFSVRRMPNGTR